MLKENKKYILILVGLISLLVVIQLNAPKPINWEKYYSKGKKTPYGVSGLYELLSQLFPEKKFIEASQPTYNILKDNNYRNTNYIFINNSFSLDQYDTEQLLSFVSQGNNVFISARYFDSFFADTFKLSTSGIDFYIGNFPQDTNLISAYLSKDTLSINFVNSQLKEKEDFLFTKQIQNCFFQSFDSSIATILGVDNQNHVNFISLKYGQGKFFINTLPEAFANYWFIDKKNCNYAFKALSYLPIGQVIWDEYYKLPNQIIDSPLRFVFNNIPLRIAYYLLIVSLLIFIIFGAKRTQRIIPVYMPLKNTTVEFTQTIGTLYFQKSDHKNLAEKKIKYFLEHIHSTFHLINIEKGEEFIRKISLLSGIGKEKTSVTFQYINYISDKKYITEHELIKLNTLIDEFKQAIK